MKLISVHVTNFKSIEDSGVVPIDPSVTVLVGQNESGKTAFLQALNKSRPVEQGIKFNVIEDYPRRLLNEYEEVHPANPAKVVRLSYRLDTDEIDRINEFSGIEIITELEFTLTYTYANSVLVSLTIDEEPYITYRVGNADLSTEVKNRALEVTNVAELIEALEEMDLNAEEAAFLSEIIETFNQNVRWKGRLLEQYLYDKYISPRIPKFVYFDDYYLLPGKVNLNDLAARIEGIKELRDEDRTAQRLLRLAGVDMKALSPGAGYESIRAKLESTGISITDKIFKFWKQNQELDVEFDVRPDPSDEPPFDSGENLYIRIRNRRHRVTVPFSQRSKGFIWFFSFIAWFDSILKDAKAGESLILLLDEPGLSLHALAQKDFLDYIDDLAKRHQILYTTHSPFMVQSDRFFQARTVEDKKDLGTKVSDRVSSSDPATLFPLQAAVGYTVAQNLFLAKKNLLVEGVADLAYLQYFSGMLEGLGREGLRDDVIITPVGGLDKLATFVALIGANQLELVVLSDFDGNTDQRIDSLVREKLIQKKHVHTYTEFRGSSNSVSVATDVEDLIMPSAYLSLFNAAYEDKLQRNKVKVGDLQQGERIVIRLNQYLDDNNISLRPSGGFNHYLVASYLASHPQSASKIGANSLNTFEALFKKINTLF